MENIVWKLNTNSKNSEESNRSAFVKLLRGAKAPIDLEYHDKKEQQQQQQSKPLKRKSSGSSDSPDENEKIAAVCSELDPTSQLFANAFKRTSSAT